MREIIFGFPAIFACLIFLVSSCCGEVKLDVRNQKFFTVKDLKRIPEYFTGREFSGWKVYCRSNPQVRDGFYFVIKVGGKKQISITDDGDGIIPEEIEIAFERYATSKINSKNEIIQTLSIYWFNIA